MLPYGHDSSHPAHGMGIWATTESKVLADIEWVLCMGDVGVGAGAQGPSSVYLPQDSHDLALWCFLPDWLFHPDNKAHIGLASACCGATSLCASVLSLAPGSCVRIAGLNLLHEMVLQFSASEFATGFYQTYYLQLVQEILAVMTGEWLHSTWPSLGDTCLAMA